MKPSQSSWFIPAMAFLLIFSVQNIYASVKGGELFTASPVLFNNSPIAINDAYAVVEGNTLTIAAPGLIENDFDPDGEEIILVNASAPLNGRITALVTNGQFAYEPNDGFTGTDEFTYRIRNASGEYSEYATVTIEVLPNPNRAPVAVEDAYTTIEGVILNVEAPGLLGNDYDPDGDELTLLSAGPLSNGRFTALVTNGRFAYEPDPGFVGTEEFNYTMRDAAGNQTTGTATIVVTPDPNGDPIAVSDHYSTTQDVPLSVDAPGLLANDYDPDGDALTLLSAGPLSNGRFTALVTNGRFAYEPDPGFVGTEEFNYTMRDAAGNQTTGTATIEVIAPGGDNPVAIPDSYVTTEGTPLNVDAPGLLGNDYDPNGDPLTLLSAGPLANGRFTTLVTNGRFGYEPDPGFVGTEEFNYTMQDPDGNRVVGVASIEVLPDPNRAPFAIRDSYITTEGVTLNVDAPGLLGNDYDPDGDPLTLLSAGPLANGRFTALVTNGRFAYEPDPGFVGTEEFNYNIRDASGNNATGSVSVVVAPDPNRAPLAVPDYYYTTVETPLVVEAPGLIGNDFDPDGDDIILVSASAPMNGRLTSLVTNGYFTYLPDPGFTGTDEFTYRIRDAAGKLSEPGTVTILVFNPNKPPVANAGDDITVVAGNEAMLDGSASSDPDGDALSYNWLFGSPDPGDPIPAGSQAVLSGASTATPSFVTDIPGEYSVELIVNDGKDDSEPDYVIVTALSIEEALELLYGEIVALGETGVINQGLVNALTRKINQSLKLYSEGKISEVLEVLAGLRQQVIDLESEGKLSHNQADELISWIDDIVHALGGVYPILSEINSLQGISDLPENFTLSAIYPNPVRTSAQVAFSLPATSAIRIIVYDVQGRQVLEVLNSTMEAGNHEVTLRADGLKSGVYLLTMEANQEFRASKRIIIE